MTLGGHEIEGVLVRALRTFELEPEPKRPLKDILGDVLREIRGARHTRKLEYMDLVAVKECTTPGFYQRGINISNLKRSKRGSRRSAVFLKEAHTHGDFRARRPAAPRFVGLFISASRRPTRGAHGGGPSGVSRKMVQYNVALAKMAGVSERLKGQ